jgi:hypothetical protein
MTQMDTDQNEGKAMKKGESDRKKQKTKKATVLESLAPL